MSNNEKSMKNLLLIAGASASMVLLSACGDVIDDNDMDESKTQPVTDQNGEKIEQPVDDKSSGDNGGNSSFFFMWLGGLGGGGSDSGGTDKKTTETTPKKDESKTNKSENKATDNKSKPSDTKTTKPRPTRGGGFGSGATNRGGGGG